MQPVETPRVFSNRYELTHQIARGGMAQVYRARDRLLDRPVALKVLFPELSVDRAFVERFRREAQSAANLSHPNIVPVYDWGEDGGTYFIVMEFIDGQPLSALLRSDGALEPARAAIIASSVAAALQHAHRSGVVHRDVKPGNVLITDDGMVKVTDFGIARAVNTEESLTQTGAVMGTAAYFSPEQAEGVGVDSRSDIYSLGVVLFEMLTGRTPFTGDTPVSVASKHVRDTPPLPCDINPAVPADLQSVVMKAMAKSPDQRYATAEDMRADLQRYLQGHPVGAEAATTRAVAVVDPATGLVPGTPAAARGVQTVAEERRQARTRRLVVVLLVLVVVLAVVAVLLLRSLGYLGGGSFALPDVVNQQAASARTTLESKGLVVAVHHETNSQPSGTVVATDPTPGSSVRAHQQVTLDVSTGPPATVPVPDVKGQPFATAAALINGMGLSYKERLQSSNQPSGTVLSQYPKSGVQVRTGSTISLTVATQTSATVPTGIVGQSEAAAGSAIKGAGLSVGTVTQQCSPSVPSGNVISVSPSGGTTVTPNSPVNLVVSTGACSVQVANVIGDSPTAAESALNFQGLSPNTQTTANCPQSSNGVVIDQNPSPGTTEPAGTTVTLTVCSNSPPAATTTTSSTTTTSTTTTTVPPGLTKKVSPAPTQ